MAILRMKKPSTQGGTLQRLHQHPAQFHGGGYSEALSAVACSYWQSVGVG